MFKPTFLYIKQHNKTGLLYFGKTTRLDVEKYRGSGVHWKRHIKKHGNDVSTLWFCLFVEKEECVKFATAFSKSNDIVNSENWANLIEENGMDGALVGHPSFITNQEEVSSKISEASLRNWSNPEYRLKMKEARKDSWTEERKLKHLEWLSTVRWTDENKKAHSEKLKGRKNGPSKTRGIPKTAEHNRKNSEALKGKPKSPEHIAKMKQPRPRLCRLFDRKEMAVSHFTRWLNLLESTSPPI